MINYSSKKLTLYVNGFIDDLHLIVFNLILPSKNYVNNYI